MRGNGTNGLNKMDEMIRFVYIAYLGNTMGVRIGAICELVKDHEGKEFFKLYSTSKDSIIEFLEKCKAKGLELW